MSKFSLLLKLFQVVPVIASDIAKATGDKFVSIREMVDIGKDILSSLGGSHLYVKITLGGEKKELTIIDIINLLEEFLDKVIDIDNAGIEIHSDGTLKFIVRTKQ